MKIAILTPEFTTEANWHGGLANYLSRVTQGLVDRAHVVHVFVCSNQQETLRYRGLVLHRLYLNEKYLDFLNQLTFRLFPVFTRMLYVAYVFRREFLKVHQHERFDIVHASSYLTPALFLHEKKIGIPIVTRMSSVMKYCQIASRRRNQIDIFLINLAEGWIIRRSRKVFVPSRLIQKLIKEEFNKEIDLIESPAYALDRNNLDHLFYDTYLKGKKYLLFYGTFGRLKGSEFIAENIHYFLHEFKDYYFVIIGKMEVNRRRRITLPIEYVLNNSREYKTRIIYVNSLPHSHLFPVIMGASAIVLPSIIDNLPNTCIEAMSLGKIVIGTYEGGFDQLITYGENGLLVHYGDHRALREVFHFVCRGEPGKLTAIGKKAQDSILERLNFEEKIGELERYYAAAIAEFKHAAGAATS